MTPVSTNATTKLPSWLTGLTGWVPTPSGADSAERRLYAGGRIALPAGVLAHAAYIAVFALWGVWPMVLVNVASVAAWALAAVAARRGGLLASYVLATGEFLAHLVLVWVFVGWGFGMQYYLIFAAAGLQLFSAVLGLRVRIVLTVLMMSLFVAGFYYTELTAPLYEVPAGPLAAVNILNIALVFALTSGAVGYTGALADRAEAALATEHARSERLLTNVLPVPSQPA